MLLPSRPEVNWAFAKILAAVHRISKDYSQLTHGLFKYFAPLAVFAISVDDPPGTHCSCLATPTPRDEGAGRGFGVRGILTNPLKAIPRPKTQPLNSSSPQPSPPSDGGEGVCPRQFRDQCRMRLLKNDSRQRSRQAASRMLSIIVMTGDSPRKYGSLNC